MHLAYLCKYWLLFCTFVVYRQLIANMLGPDVVILEPGLEQSSSHMLHLGCKLTCHVGCGWLSHMMV